MNPLLFPVRIQKAIRFSIKTHEVYQKQKRKGKDIPYITHPLTVGIILARTGASEAVVIAGVLHDTIEDSTATRKVTKEMITDRFGEDVATLVDSVTEQDKDLPWEDRKREALEHIATFSNDSLLVKSADVIANGSELIEDYREHGEDVFANFNAPKDKILGHYLRVIETITAKWPDSPLAADLEAVKASIGSM